MSKATEMIVKAKHLNADDVTYKTATVDSRGGKKVQIRLKGQPLVISAPMMFTWGVNERVDENSGRVSYDANLVFESDKSSSVAAFCKNMKGLQEKLLNDAVKNSKEWFGKSKMSKEVAEAMMYKLPFWEGKFNVELYDTQSKPTFLPTKDGCEGPQGNKTPVDLVPSRSYIKGLIACNGLWMAGGRFGVTWKLVQAQVRPPVRLVGTGVCHLEADSDDDEMLESVQKEEEENEEDNATSLPHFDDSAEDDEEEDEEVKAETPPPPKKKKKVVRRKKTKSSA
jgi:hypothetical protein